MTLTALIETHAQKREEFEKDTTIRKEELGSEIKDARNEWEREKELYEIKQKEQESEEGKTREREKEEYKYDFEREQQLARDNFEDEKAKIEREMQLKRELEEKQLAEREEKITQKEEELIDLRNRVNSIPKEKELAVNDVVKEITQKCNIDKKRDEELLKKIFEGERNVLTTRINAFEKNTKEQSEQISKLLQ